MTREDLKKYRRTQQWVKARIEFYQEQKNNIGKLTATISDMPKGSPIAMDKEAEAFATLEDKINELIAEIADITIKEEKRITEQLNKMEKDNEDEGYLCLAILVLVLIGMTSVVWLN